MDPYVGINDDFQVFMKPQSEVKDYGSASDNEAALSALVKLRDKAHESDKIVFAMLVEGLSMITKVVFSELYSQSCKEKRLISIQCSKLSNLLGSMVVSRLSLKKLIRSCRKDSYPMRLSCLVHN